MFEYNLVLGPGQVSKRHDGAGSVLTPQELQEHPEQEPEQEQDEQELSDAVVSNIPQWAT